MTGSLPLRLVDLMNFLTDCEALSTGRISRGARRVRRGILSTRCTIPLNQMVVDLRMHR